MAQKGNSPASRPKGTVTQETPFNRMLRDMAALATAEEENASFNGDVLAAIYGAETEDDIWDADSVPPLNGKLLAGCELALYDLAVKYSRARGEGDEIRTPWVYTDERGREKKMYLLVTCARISNAGAKKLYNLPGVGEQFQFNTSAQFLTAKLFTFYVRGKFGDGRSMQAAIQATDLGGDQQVLKLVRVPERVHTVTTVPVEEDGEQETLVSEEELQAATAMDEPPF